MIQLDLTVLDYAALVWFLTCWAGLSVFADHSRWHARSTTGLMTSYHRRWMQVMAHRENRIVDTATLGNLLHGVAFFASTSILAIGGLVAMLGAGDMAVQIIRDLPFAAATSRLAWELKALLLIATLIFAFFKFARAFRLCNYCTILIGATPLADDNPAEAEAMADRAASMSILASYHYIRGIRAYFFGLAILSWFLHPLLFLASTTWIVLVIYRREFRSRTLEIIGD